MSWSFTIPGQPFSWDRAYRTGTMPVTRGGRPVLNEDLSPRMIRRPVLTKEAEAYRDTVQILAKLAYPTGWLGKLPLGAQLRITLDLRLAHDMDADNALKLILDGLARGMDYDDRHFLPCVASKTVGRKPSEACVIVTVEEIA